MFHRGCQKELFTGLHSLLPCFLTFLCITELAVKSLAAPLNSTFDDLIMKDKLHLPDDSAVKIVETVDTKNDSLNHHQTPFPAVQKNFKNEISSVRIVPLKLDEVQPPDHVDGLRMEQDGHLNADYKKEILFGNHEEFEQAGSEKKLLSRLKVIFIKADLNHDSFLIHDELKAWILVKVQEHLQEAVAENARIFKHLDSNRDGLVSWKEFHFHFLLAKGHDQNETLKHVEDYDTLAIDPEDRERLIRYKFRWAEADEEPQDNLLTVEEMKNFRHPEQSSKMIIRMAKDILDNLDRDEDGIITEEEFVALPPGDLDGMAHDRNADEVWQNERRKEFRNVIDVNHDGRIDVEELKLYVDPHNENHAHLEADNLIQLADQNSDGKLSIAEVLDNAELFLGSKMVDTGRNFHDEF